MLSALDVSPEAGEVDVLTYNGQQNPELKERGWEIPKKMEKNGSILS